MAARRGGQARPRRSPEAGAERAGGVQSLARALRLLQAIARSHDGLTLTELAQTVGLPPSTAHRLLSTLQAERFVRFDPIGHLWQVGVEAFTVGNGFVRTRDVVLMARPRMRRLMEESGETVNLYLAAEEGEAAVCMAQVECRQMMRAIARPGGRVALHCSGVGKALLAWMSEREVGRALERHGLPQVTDNTIRTPAALRAELERTRARGFAVDDEEHAVGLRCVAAAVLDEHGRPLAGLSVSGPTARVADHRLALLGALVAGAAREITAELGGGGAAAHGHPAVSA